MSTRSFQPGDVVRLKSGGPRMTVCKPDHKANHPDDVPLVWFKNEGQGVYSGVQHLFLNSEVLVLLEQE